MQSCSSTNSQGERLPTPEEAMKETADSRHPIKNGDLFILDLSTGSKNPARDAEPKGFFVRGHMKENSFIPESMQILGDGELAQTGAGLPGWYELNICQFFPMQTGRAPASPYVNGFMTKAGFVPSSRQIR